MRDLRCPDDRRRNRPLLSQPSKRDMNTRNPMLFRDLRDPLHDLSIGFGCRIVLAFPTRFDRFRTAACVRTTSHSSVFRIRDTSIPVFPSFVYSIVFSLSSD